MPQNGADILRNIAKRLRSGEVNILQMASDLEGVAIGPDILYKEMKDTDLRELQRKASLWDRAEAMLMEDKK